MSLFQYKAIDTQGRKTQGVVNAADSSSAAGLLREGSLFILELTEKGFMSDSRPVQEHIRRARGFKHFWRSLLPMTKRDIIFFFRQLALMRRTGLTLLQSLEICRGQASKPRLEWMMNRLIDAVQSGSSLSGAMTRMKKYFPGIAVKMIITAEATGELAEILDQIAVQMERRQELKNTIVTGLMYPVLVVLIMLGVVAFLVTKVVPRFASFLAQRDLILPPATQFLMDLSKFLTTHQLAILISCVFGFMVIITGYMIPRTRLMIDRLLLALPIVGSILTTASMAYLGRTLSILLRSGVSLLESIHVMSEGIPNRAISRHLEEAENEVLKGQNFSKGLRSSIIPTLVTEIVHVGEVTGSLDQVLDELGAFYEQNLNRQIKWMTTLFEPVMILVVGGTVAFVYFAFFQVLYQLARV